MGYALLKTAEWSLTILAVVIITVVFVWLTAGYGLCIAAPVAFLYIICGHFASYIFGE